MRRQKRAQGPAAGDMGDAGGSMVGNYCRNLNGACGQVLWLVIPGGGRAEPSAGLPRGSRMGTVRKYALPLRSADPLLPE